MKELVEVIAKALVDCLSGDGIEICRIGTCDTLGDFRSRHSNKCHHDGRAERGTD